MDVLREEHSILRLAEGIAKGDRTVTLDAKDARQVLDRVKNLEDALTGLLRSTYERSVTAATKSAS